MDTNSRQQELLRKYLSNESTTEELEELFDCLDAREDDSYRVVMDELWSRISAEKRLSKQSTKQVLNRIIQRDASFNLGYKKIGKWSPLAATILMLIVGAGCIYLIANRKNPLPSVAEEITERSKEDIKPGGKRAILQAGKEEIALSTKDTSFVLAGNTVHINGGDVTVAHVRPVQYTLKTPRGGEYSLVLGDGTKIWLNADSKLTYPSIFRGNTREVRLTGEGYFKVKEDANRPFIVHTEKQSVQVLGTEFNIKAYHEEAICMTTLVKGKVQVNSFGKRILLEPGQQAISDNQGQFRKQDAGIHKVTAWKDGYFWFDKTGIHDIMWQLSRWYDVGVKYEDGLQPHQFMAIVSRDNDIRKILELLQGTGAVHFVIIGNEVTVMEGKQ